MLLPARVKHRKLHRGRRTGVATQGADLAFGEFGLQASEAAWMTNRQIEAARPPRTRYLRRGGPGLIPGFTATTAAEEPGVAAAAGSPKGAPGAARSVNPAPGAAPKAARGVAPKAAAAAPKAAAPAKPAKGGGKK